MTECHFGFGWTVDWHTTVVVDLASKDYPNVVLFQVDYFFFSWFVVYVLKYVTHSMIV